MKHARLRAIVHNLADSLGSGCSLLSGEYTLDIYADAAAAPSGALTVDFLKGAADAPTSPEVRAALSKMRLGLPAHLARSGANIDDLKEAHARYWSDPTRKHFTIRITDRNGRVSEADYTGDPGARRRELDPLGRLRRRPIRGGSSL